MNEAEEKKAYEDWLHQSPEFADTIISAWDVWQARAALAQPEPAAPTFGSSVNDKPACRSQIDESETQAAPVKTEADAWCDLHCADEHVAGCVRAEPVAGWLIYAAGDEANGAFWRTKPDDEQLETMASECGLPVIARSLHIAANPPRTALTLDDALIRAMALEHSSASFGRAGDDDSTGGWMFDYDDLIVFARAIEAAHNIGGPRNE